MVLKARSLMSAPRALACAHFTRKLVMWVEKSSASLYCKLRRSCSALSTAMSDATWYPARYDFHASAAVPATLIPSPMGFQVLKMRRPLVQAFLTFHSAAEGVGESHGVSAVTVAVVVVVVAVVVVAVVAGGVMVMVGMTVGVVVPGLGIIPSRYPDAPRNSAAMQISPFHATQFVPSNFSVSAKIGGALPPVELIVYDVKVVYLS